MSESPRPSGRMALLWAIPVLIILLPLAYSLVSSITAQGADATEAFLERPDPEKGSCVREKAYMRYHHWELLREIREEVVRYGRREEIERNGKRMEVGLNTCKECHTSRERFCDQCHHAVSLYPDCFDCHAYE
jgi:hypothetical protein